MQTRSCSRHWMKCIWIDILSKILYLHRQQVHQQRGSKTHSFHLEVDGSQGPSILLPFLKPFIQVLQSESLKHDERRPSPFLTHLRQTTPRSKSFTIQRALARGQPVSVALGVSQPAPWERQPSQVGTPRLPSLHGGIAAGLDPGPGSADLQPGKLGTVLEELLDSDMTNVQLRRQRVFLLYSHRQLLKHLLNL